MLWQPLRSIGSGTNFLTYPSVEAVTFGDVHLVETICYSRDVIDIHFTKVFSIIRFEMLIPPIS